MHAPCFGYSFKSHVAVWPELTSRIPVTFSLAIGAAVIWVVSGVAIGVISALKPGSILDRLFMGVALAGVSLPIFFTGMLALGVFTVQWPIWSNGINYVPFTQNPADWAWNLLMPWCSLAFLYSALYARLTRAGMLETMSEDYIRTARAKGLRERNVVAKHGLRSALTPDRHHLRHGLRSADRRRRHHRDGLLASRASAQYAIQGVQNNDLPIVLGVTLVAAFFIVICNLLVDLVYAAIDPRVRLS